MPKNILAFMALIIVSLSLAGCANTATGVSQDIRHFGHEAERTFR